ncbi:xanthine dehydrogenase family protein molybdopterin-binding subunit [Ruegeria sp. Ofav3-42]|uniref:xanthine dehydrogenase family protein molybdopterin-binding subunit n=1 Tax=Ruegeria sp. Ofav3-42 TaxID=2917759 RepID=UPI001EF64E5E|nr:molybdopterin cofactor-binding domain-containing protein [Ruegeria sp. Ofav3-42]MCG7522452.1 molybdopterin-dependent oxidoreductase [Ruegeria sp. Ofav3-42]
MTKHDKIVLSRRGFLSAAIGTAGAVAFNLTIPAPAHAAAEPVELHSWVVIKPDNRVAVRIPQVEMGQGCTTALAQYVMEELDLDPVQTDWEYYDPATNQARDNVYVHTATLASFGMEMLFMPMRTAGAQIRAMLVQAAATRLGVDAGSLSVEGHAIGDGSASVSFAEVAADAAALSVPQGVSVKDPSQWKVIGKPLDRVDAFSKSTGQAVYGMDLQMEGMKYAAVKQSPVYGGKLISFDFDAIKDMPGVIKAVAIKAGPTGYTVPPTLWDIIDWEMDDAVAVVADTWWEAQQALNALPITWHEGRHRATSTDSIEADLGAALDAGGMVVRNEGDVETALQDAAQTVEAEYHYPYLEHAPMEVMNATALVDGINVEAWAPTQYGDEALRIAAYAAGITTIRAKFHMTLAGGGFGRRLHNDYVSQAVQVAKQMKGTPIKLIASREECLARSYYSPIMTARFKGGVDADGNVTAWKSHSAQGRSVLQPYGMTRTVFPFANINVQYSSVEDTPLPFAWMRGVGHTQNAWMNHGFMSELAAAAGMETVDFHLKHLRTDAVAEDRADKDDAIARIKRFQRVYDHVLSKAGPAQEQGKGRGRGVAVYDMSYVPGFHSSCIGIAVDLRLEDGDVKLERVTASVDCGLAVNPQIIEAQIQSGIMFGLSNAINGKITIADGKVEQSNFDSYDILRLGEAPQMDVHIMPSEEKVPAGIGEGAVPVVIGALVDAVWNAGGPRIRRLPVRDHDLTLRG